MYRRRPIKSEGMKSFKRRDIPRKTEKVDLTDREWINKIPECPIYSPSEQEFEDPMLYLHKIAPEAYKYGICKIVSPRNASIPASIVLMEELKDFKFETIVQPLRHFGGSENNKITFSLRGRKYTYRDFEILANKVFLGRFYSCADLPPSYVEKLFWHEMEHGEKETIEYGVNVEGSAFSCDPHDKLGRSKWNLKNFSRLQKSILRLIDKEIPGITDPMLYIGMLFSMFAWHVEDHYLYSINYHHSGASKTWYGVPGHAASRLEDVVSDHVYCNREGEGAFQALANKTTMFCPVVLLQHDVPIYKAVQKPGEFIITFPRAYHAGFSHGFNCGEAVNFAISDWFPLGAEATRRYAHLRMVPIIPFEELLCKEAMLIYKASKVRGLKNKPNDLDSCHGTKLCFMHLMGFYKQALLRVNKSSRKCSSSLNSLVTVVCSHCQRDCYVAYMLCKYCYSHPICLFHDNETQTCSCGRQYTIFKRDDMKAMNDAAARFEQEKDVLLGVQREINCGVNMLSLPRILSCSGKERTQDIKNKPSHEERSASRTVPSNESSLKKREGNTVKLNLKQTKILLKFSKKRGHSTVCTDKGAQMNSKLQRNE